jgi:hypothetical protein
MNSWKGMRQGFYDALAAACAGDPSLKAARDKTRALLEDYARSVGTTAGGLLFVHVCDESGALRRELEEFVMTDYPLADASRPSYRSNIRRLVRAAGVGVENGLPNISVGDVPGALAPLLTLLPRRKGGSKMSLEARLRLPLSTPGACYLLACVRVYERLGARPPLAELVGDHAAEIGREAKLLARKLCGRDVVGNVSWRVQRALNLPHRVPAFTPLEQLPEPLRSEIEHCRDRAQVLGSGQSAEERQRDRELVERLAREGIGLTKRRVRTVDNYQTRLSTFFGHVRHLVEGRGQRRFGVRDLLRLVSVRGGDGGRQKINPYVQAYRERELARDDVRSKRAGFDSVSFQATVNAIKAVALFNGICDRGFHRFARAYEKIVLDSEATDDHKQLKKKIFTIEVLDAETVRMEARFKRVIRSGSFRRAPGRSLRASDRDLAFCVFYVIFAMFRYLGHRQQCVRHCALGENIIFYTDGSIVLQYGELEVKNGKPLRVKLTPERDDGKWGRVYRALTLYRRKIYTYLIGRAAEKGAMERVGSQFFLHLYGSDVRNFPEARAAEFASWFGDQVHAFMLLPQEAYDHNIIPHAQFLRGACVDWLRSLGMSFQEISVITGDTEQVLRQKYANKRAVNDSTLILASTDRRLAEEERFAPGTAGGAQRRLPAGVDVDELISQNGQLIGQIGEARAEAAAARAECAALECVRDELLARISRLEEAAKPPRPPGRRKRRR